MINIKTIILSLFILQPWLLDGLIRLDVIAIFLGVLLCLFQKNIKFPLKEFIFLSISISIVLFFTIIHLEFDVSLLKRYITLAVLIIGSYYICEGFNLKRKDLIKSLYLMIFICTIFYSLAIFFDSFRDFALLLKGETYGIEDKLEVYRLWFPTSAHTFNLGLFFVIAITILLSEKSSIFFIFLCILCASISARSALLMSIALCFAFVILKDKRYLIVLLLAIPALYLSIVFMADKYTEVKYMLEPVEQLLSTGTLQSKSSDDLLDKHLFLPDFNTIIFGDGKYINSDGLFYGHTDSGIIRPILYGGIFFQAFYFLFLYRYVSVLRIYGSYGIITIALLFLANIKSEILSTTPYFSLIMILYFIVKREKSITLKDTKS